MVGQEDKLISSVMLNEVKHLYNKDSSLTLRMTVSVIIYIVTNY